VLASIIDITERKRREEQLHLQSMALESAANAIVITDANGKIIWVNKAFTESTGYFPEEVIGQNPRFLKSGQTGENFYKEMWDTILSGKVWRNTIVNRRKDGSLINEDMTITPIRDTAGNITQFIAIKQDITELEKAVSTVRARNEELASMTQQLWQASRLATVGELAASIAHELNNPLATISLRLEMLSEQLDGDDPKRHAVDVVADEVERMGNLVGNLLQFSRRTHRQISTIDVRDEVERSLELTEYHLRSNNIEVEREFAEGLSPIQADRQQLRQVFLNLLTNAADAMPQAGKVTVRIAPKKDDSGRELIQLLFVDKGAGIPPENVEKIWDPFFTTKPEGKGTGLGLAICRRVIEEHHGSIGIESTVGQGTTVIVQLPTSNSNSSILDQEESADAIEVSNV
jgi:PAS domain S-box-containing protein